MKISLSIDLDQEQTDALQERVDLYNSGSGQPAVSASDFVKTVQVQPYIQTLVDQRYAASLNRLGGGFRGLPYDVRLATISDLESKIAP